MSLLVAMSRGHRLLYTIPAITPCMQRKIIIYVFGILNLLVGGHVQEAQVVAHHPDAGPAILSSMQRKIIIYVQYMEA
jgi:hypothetical protein